jgi:DNA polymerase III subunit alpha
MNSYLQTLKPNKLKNKGVRLPKFKISKSKYGATDGSEEQNYAFFKKLCSEGLKEKLAAGTIKESDKQKYIDQARYELKVIRDLGFVDYFLLVWEVVDYCRQQDIAIGLGRGSAAGSIILFLCGITGVDPIQNDLIFERFLSTDRVEFEVIDGEKYFDGGTLPDIDLDFDYYKRPKLLEYLQEKYDAVKILNLNTFAGKQLTKDCGKTIAEYSEDQMNAISSLLPVEYGKVMDLEEAYEKEEKFKEWADENKEIFEIACKLRGLIRNRAVHASGMLIPFGKSEDNFPMELTSGKDKMIVSSFDMGWSGNIAIKLDVLGLKTLSVVDETCKKIGINFTDIDVNDNFIYQQLQDFKYPYGIFQLEAFAAYNGCRSVKPKNISELSAVLAICRPGALQFLEGYSKYTNTGESESPEPYFDDILGETGGFCLYQEQLMRMLHKVGFSLNEANHARKVIGKKLVKKVGEWKEKIYNKIKEKGLETSVADNLWSIMEASANYSFNKSHALSYATLSAITIYLKFKHPKEFFHSLLRMTIHEQDPMEHISTIEKEMEHFGIKLLPPDIIKSEMDFSIEGGDIRYGLTDIKGINTKSIEKLGLFKSEYNNKMQVFQNAKEAGVPMNVLCPLIQAGALTGFQGSRTRMVYEAQIWNKLTDREKRFAIQLSESHNNDLFGIMRYMRDNEYEEGKPYIKDSRMNTIRKHIEPYKNIYDLNKVNEKFANWWYEKKLLGFSCKNRLKDIFNDQLNLIGLEEINNNIDKKILVVGTAKSVIKRTSKNGNVYIDIVLEDEKAELKTKIFENGNKIEMCEDRNGRLPEKGDILVVRGQAKQDCLFADEITIQKLNIYMKLSELK